MNKVYFGLVIFINVLRPAKSQDNADSLVRFADLNYHSELEKAALYNYVNHRTDTFNLFMAIDENVGTEDASKCYQKYLSICNELHQKQIESKKINRRIKSTYTIVHNQFLRKYDDDVYYPAIFTSGLYNCVSASMIYSLVFDQMKIPYKVMASSNHVYLVSNPGKNSIVIETTNPGFEKTIFTGEFKQQYIDYLRNSKLISETEYKNKSVEEIFEEKYNQVKEAQFWNLFGFQYYNKALVKLNNNEMKEGYELSQKAYFFCPDEQMKTLLFTALVFQIEKCPFDKVSDIDYLAHLSRFDNTETEILVSLFNNVVANHMQYTNKEAYCDSLFQRLASQISDSKKLEEISFAYYMQMSYRYQNSDKVEPYIYNALKIKGNHYDANAILTNYIHRMLSSIYDAQVLLDSVQQMENKYTFENIQPLVNEYKMIAYLKMAEESYTKNDTKTGEEYLGLFEQNCIVPITNPYLIRVTEITYHNIAVKLFYRNNKTKAKNIVERGLEYLPYSRLIKSAVY